MELTTYLSQVLGLFLIITGASIMLRKCYYVPVVGEFIEDRLMRMVMGIIELLAGLFLALGIMGSTGGAALALSVIGWLLVLEGAAYLLLPESAIAWVIKHFNVPTWYALGGTLSIVLGAWLFATGFGIL